MSTPSKDYLSTVVIAPHVSEKAARIATEGNQYVFRVRRDGDEAGDPRRRRVHVRSEGGHRARRERSRARQSASGARAAAAQDWKKAYVRLAEGQQIELGGSERA